MEKAIVMADKAFLTPNDPIKKELFQQVIEMYRRLGSRYFEREDDFTRAKHSKSVFYYKRAAVLARKSAWIQLEPSSLNTVHKLPSDWRLNLPHSECDNHESVPEVAPQTIPSRPK
ncbi:hypothetical protein TNIN_461991 [Trichonephila inaurata madagascariensis]|uniref:Uncharacterized protein n=1 Tax=Trichonephila inaurata madagascariensis TaxID=2747483 RepID=A0A8X6YDW4_9ARAC|nr:hypothetical protein TNIN_461991 [Trichonephila inaurata madagascariensis]